MNKLQEQSLQAKNARYITDIIDEGIANDEANHAKTQEMLGELLNRYATPEVKKPQFLFGGVALNCEFYNLFVIGGENFNSGSFTISKVKVFSTEYIEPGIKKQFSKMRDDSVVEQILSLPSLFMNENTDYMKSRPGQKALFGRVTDLTIEPNDIRISFHAETQIFQQNVTDISQSLGVISNPGYSELNHTHWTIKRIDLMKVLAETGLMVLQYN